MNKHSFALGVFTGVLGTTAYILYKKFREENIQTYLEEKMYGETNCDVCECTENISNEEFKENANFVTNEDTINKMKTRNIKLPNVATEKTVDKKEEIKIEKTPVNKDIKIEETPTK